MPTYRIQHITSYEYDRPVTESVNEIRIFPYACTDQEVLQHELVITGQPDIQYYHDYWGNRCGVFSLVPAHTELVIESRLLVRTLATQWPAMQNNSSFEQLATETGNNLSLLELTRTDAFKKTDVIDDFVRQIFQPWKTVAATIQDCSQFIHSQFKYIKGITNVETTVDEILEHRAGVCQDFAHVMLQMLRSLHIPSRYVSGYICPNRTGLRGEGATHAWVESYIPGTGWAGIDPTNNIWVTNHHVKLAVGRNFSDCSPVKGSFRGPARQKLFVYVAVDYENGQHTEERSLVGTPVEGESRYLFPAADTDTGGMQQ